MVVKYVLNWLNLFVMQEILLHIPTVCACPNNVPPLLRYGVGILLGLLTVHWTKKVLRALPVIGRVLSPLLGWYDCMNNQAG